VVAGSGSLRSDDPAATVMQHRWTDAGVTVLAPFTGAHLLHLSVAGCVLNDVHREAQALGVEVRGVRVTAQGGFDEAWRSTGISYAVELDSPASADERAALLSRVDAVAEIPQAVRAGAGVTRA